MFLEYLNIALKRSEGLPSVFRQATDGLVNELESNQIDQRTNDKDY